MTYAIQRIRDELPALASGVAFFDGPGGTQTPQAVADAIGAALAAPLSNRGRETPGALNAERIVVDARQAMADLLGADPRGVVFGRSATQLTYDLSRALAATWRAGDEVVVTRLDHDANVRPWIQAAERVGAVVRWADLDPETGELGPVPISDRTRLVAVTGASNLIGTMPPIAELAHDAHDAGALVHVDGVHRAAHVVIDMAALGADSFVCSPYKLLGPHHGVLAAAPELLEGLQPDKLLPSTDDVPERFELGTLPYELLAGTIAAIDFLAGIAPGDATDRRARLEHSMAAVEAHEDGLRARIEAALADLPGVTVHSRAKVRTPTLLLTFAGHECAAVSAHLAARDIAAPSGSFYALEPSRRLGLGDAGGLRIGLAPYTDDDDVHRLLAALIDALT